MRDEIWTQVELAIRDAWRCHDPRQRELYLAVARAWLGLASIIDGHTMTLEEALDELDEDNNQDDG